MYLIDTGLDHLIPFSKYAVFLYCTWHLEIAAILLSFLHLRDFDGYWHTAGRLLLKQHSVIDAAGGIILALVIEVAAESVLSAWRQRRRKVWASTVLSKI